MNRAERLLPERRNSLPTLGRGFKGVRRSTPLLNDDEKLRGLGADIERIESA
jgi:hypothetical protein